MLLDIRKILGNHINNNRKTYFCLAMLLIIGTSAGAFTVKGLCDTQKEQLINYFHSFLQLYKNQKDITNGLLGVSLIENFRVVILLWLLGLTIIGIPFIFLMILAKGFILGFTSGFIIHTLELKGILFVFATLIPKEIIILPCLMALCVNGINFSLNIIRHKSFSYSLKENLKTNFIAYCTFTLIFSGVILFAVLLETYISPILIKIFAN